jgi:hypothetical protein
MLAVTGLRRIMMKFNRELFMAHLFSRSNFIFFLLNALCASMSGPRKKNITVKKLVKFP